MDDLASSVLPMGWRFVKASYESFAKQDDRWRSVEGKEDLVLTEVPRDENNEDWIRQLVTHAGRAMKLTGVCHMFCTCLQFSKIFSAVNQEGMEMMQYPMIYIEDCTKTKKRTLSQRPQESNRCAAVFWRSPDKATRHHYSFSNRYPNSSTPAWTNIVTNVEVRSERLLTLDGVEVKVQVFAKDLMTFVLEQWCAPAGLCYNPRAKGMTAGLACYDLGMQYVALEEEEGIYEGASRNVINEIKIMATESVSHRHVQKRLTPSISADNAQLCGIGNRLCKFPGTSPTRKCKGKDCEKPMHDLCHWAKVVMGVDIGHRELVSVCSRHCYENQTSS